MSTYYLELKWRQRQTDWLEEEKEKKPLVEEQEEAEPKWGNSLD